MNGLLNDRFIIPLNINEDKSLEGVKYKLQDNACHFLFADNIIYIANKFMKMF